MVLTPFLQRSGKTAARRSRLDAFQRARKSRVILLIHRQELVNFLGVPLARYIDIEDSEAVLRAIRLTPTDVPIDLIVHTPGGLVLAAEQIAHAVLRHPAPVTMFVPHYAMSGGTLLALACDRIVMDPNAVLGPVDPQLGPFPAASILEAVAQKPAAAVSDQTLIDGRHGAQGAGPGAGRGDRDPDDRRHGAGQGRGVGGGAGDGDGDARLPDQLRAGPGARAAGERRLPERGPRVDEPVRDADQPAAVGHVRAAADGGREWSRERPARAAAL